MMPSRKILWIVPKWSLPVIDGARVATEKLAKNMIKAGALVDIACVGEEGEKIDREELIARWGVRKVYSLPRSVPSGKWRRVFYYLGSMLFQPKVPLTMSSFSNKKIRKQLCQYLNAEDYDWVLLDGLHLGACFFEKSRFIKPKSRARFLYRAHNIEQHLWSGAGKEKPLPLRLFYRYQERLVAKIEAQVINECDLVAPISPEDHGWILGKFPTVNTHLALLGMDFTGSKTFVEKERKEFLFVGRLDWPPNRDGLSWFLRNVFPKLDYKKVFVHIAGSGSNDWLANYVGVPGLQVHGFVKDLGELYERCDATIAPVFFGSGTRIKVIESYAMGRPVITGSLGAQGSGLRKNVEYFHVETETAWVNTLNSFDGDLAQNMAKLGRERLSMNYDEAQVGKSLYSCIL